VPEGCLEKGWPVQDGGDERRVALTFTWNIVPAGAKVAVGEHKGPVCAWVTYVLLPRTSLLRSIAVKGGREGFMKVPIRKYILERISLKGGGEEG